MIILLTGSWKIFGIRRGLR